MKTRKAIAVLLAVVMLAIPFAVVSYAAPSVVEGPIKTVYTDCEKFIPQGIVVSVDGELIPYTPIDESFAFVPGLDEFLTISTNADGEEIHTQQIEVYYNNQFAGVVEVEVNHVLGDVTFLSEAGHGQYCLGCGKVCNYAEHDIPEFIPNDDGSLLFPQTETGKCIICHGEVTRNIPGSEDFQYIFGDNLSDLAATIVGYIYTIAVSLIQALVGIK